MIQAVTGVSNYYDISIKTGENYVIPLTFNDSDGNVIDLTGAKIHFVLKEKMTSDTKIIDKQVDSHIDAENGISQVVLTNVETKPLRGPYYYSVELEQADNTETVVLEGRFSVEGAPTKDEDAI